MTPRHLPLLLLSSLLFATDAAARTDQDEAERPNLLLILPDQWRGSALGFLGEEPVLTPCLDRFAEESLVLTDAVSNYPLCSPYRAMLMTGRYPFSNGVLGNCNSEGTPYGYELGKDERCWSDVLHDAGYSLGYVGKWHLEAPRRPYVRSYNNRSELAWNEWTPPDRRHGFGFWYAYNTYDLHMRPQYWTTTGARDERVKVSQWGPAHEADQAIRFLRNEEGAYREAGAPFALVVAMNPPHTPYEEVPEAYVERYADRSLGELLAGRPNVWPADTEAGAYTREHLRHQYAMMTGVDEQVGRVLDALRELELEDDTIVVFTSDHGDCLGMHGAIAKNQHYEASMRVPFLVRWPGHIEPRRDDLLLSTPDVYPTLLALTGLAARTPEAVEGVDLSKAWLGGGGPRPTSQLYLRVPRDTPAQGRRGVRTARYTLMVEREGDDERVELYDRATDPHEVVDLADREPELVERLRREELAPWLERTGDPWSGR